MEAKLKHLEFIQTSINRFNSNGFLIKGWAVSLVAALFALAAKDANARYVLITYISTVLFWVLDAYYLSQERQYRALYQDVAQRELSQIDFTMDASGYRHGRASWWSAAIAPTLLMFYGSLVVLPALLLLVLTHLA
ncbi:hypothetical protein K3G63_11205 [Hymenobacter sp. HSC-4F20]|uniref:hypothetical protein n=1 Tax=Hymenobacter sp. HSC-4F20 TaxID=2864135 RepID=UPI001C735873|nr:hypothetical protein [Hymenobacter sp. HSC-4F20]MBX0291011.1 hypothetical protein [Hymenobacter sp. HSC-4F20]